MKKTIIAFVMGAALATAGSVYGAEIKSLVGTSVTIEGQYPVKVNGVTAEKQAIVFDGTSYLPVRAIGDALNMDVGFDADLGIELTPKEPLATETTAKEAAAVTEVLTITPEDAEAIKTSEEQIVISEKRVVEFTSKVKSLEDDLNNEQIKLNQASDSIEKQSFEGKISSIKASIEVTNQLLQASKDNILSQQAYITKIKAKYGL